MARTSSSAAVAANDPTQVTAGKFAELARSLQIGEAVLRAVAQVESAGGGFVSPSKPKILFEGHAFHRLTGGRFDRGHPNLSHPKWDRKQYSGSLLGEWKRLEGACLLDRPAALQSASWGMFQIMGFNYAYCGMLDVEAFVAAQCDSADRQLELFARFISRERFLDALRAVKPQGPNVQAWTNFARAYNGPQHEKNNYVGKLETAYRRWLAQTGEAPAAAGSRRRPSRATADDDTAMPMGRVDFEPLDSTRRRVPERRRNVRPDPVDLRDWQYQPNIAIAPSEWMLPNNLRPVKHQADSNACTGFALATVIEYLLAATRDRPVEPISGYMLYDMARRYDEWVEPTDVLREEGQRLDAADLKDEGSSVRGALKGWSRQGASSEALWSEPEMPAATNRLETDWWLDAVMRPMGAYYRIQPENIRDIHIALAEVGVVYASAFTHAGWDSLMNMPENGAATSVDLLPLIPEERSARDLGHAFAIVGYTRQGFIVQNSWGADWGRNGLAVLSYDDWMANAMDCWVVQLGVVTVDHHEVARSSGLRADASGTVRISRDVNLADHEISPYVINMENNGRLSPRGRFRTQPEDVKLLIGHQMVEACKLWKIPRNGTLDVAVYAHGGLTDEDAAAVTARYWLPHLYSNRLFPIFLMWETGATKTFNNILQDAVFGADEEKTAGGRWSRMRERIDEWRDERLEGLARWPGSKLWGEMKQNAEALSGSEQSGVVQLFKAFEDGATRNLLPRRIRLHLIGHSAGAIVHTHLAPRAIAKKLEIASVSLMAPAVRMDTFQRNLGGLVAEHRIPMLVANLTDAAERADNTCKPYGRSLLYLVSRSFEDQEPTPIMGMERHLVPALPTNAWGGLVDQLVSPGGTWGAGCGVTRATSHGGMDNDPAVREAIVSFILHGPRRALRTP